MSKEFEQMFFQRRSTNGQSANEQMLSITNYEANADQTTMRYHLVPTRKTTVKHKTHSWVWWHTIGLAT